MNKTDTCWLWTGTTAYYGYGAFAMNGKVHRAHRIAWELTHGPIPAGLNVCHNCPGGDVPACVNPHHLFLGDQKANMADASMKGRTPRGERQGRSKLSESDIHTIRYRYAAGEGQAAIAHTFGVTPSQISQIVRLNEWTHILTPGYRYTGNRRIKFSPEQRAEIQARRTTGSSLHDLAIAYHTDKKHIWRIATARP